MQWFLFLGFASLSCLLGGCGKAADDTTTTTAGPVLRTCLVSSWPPAAFNDNSACDNLGLGDLSEYRHGEALQISDDSGVPLFIPYFSSAPLDGKPNEEARVAVIWIHGEQADANTYFCNGIAAARAAHMEARTITVAPWFGSEKIRGREWSKDISKKMISTCWGDKDGDWTVGASSWDPKKISTSSPQEATSFGIVDLFVKKLRDTKQFPNLSRIAIAGFSAGCQMASRWTFFSNSPAAEGTKVTTVLGACGTYLYLNELRPDSTCRALHDTGSRANCSRFVAPGPESQKSCPQYHRYKFGTDFTGQEMRKNSYVAPFASDSSKLEAAISSLPHKDVRLLLGDKDACQCNVDKYENPPECMHTDRICLPTLFEGCCDTFPDVSSNVCEHACEGLLQGSSRLQRGLNYAAYLHEFFKQKGTEYSLPLGTYVGGHNAVNWAQSPMFANWVWAAEKTRGSNRTNVATLMV